MSRRESYRAFGCPHYSPIDCRQAESVFVLEMECPREKDCGYRGHSTESSFLVFPGQGPWLNFFCASIPAPVAVQAENHGNIQCWLLAMPR